MDSPDLIDGYLMRSGLAYESVGEGIWVIHDDVDHIDNIFVTWSPPIVVFRVKLMNAPTTAKARADLFETLLRLNATEMVAGAYGLEDDSVIATETLQAENLDFNEFQAGIDGLSMAIVEHYDELKKFHHLDDAA